MLFILGIFNVIIGAILIQSVISPHEYDDYINPTEIKFIMFIDYIISLLITLSGVLLILISVNII